METTAAAAALPEPRLVRAGRGADWIGEAFALFRQQPGVWIGILVIWLVLSSVIAAVPVLNLLGSFLNPVFTAGIMLGCASQARGEGLRVEHLFAGFRSGRVGPLLMMTVWTLLLAAAGLVALVAVVGWPVFDALEGLHDPSPEELLGALGLGRLLWFAFAALTLAALLAMAVWFAPALIVFRGVSALDALKLSFRGCVRNWRALAVYGLLVLVMLILAALPLLLGLLIAVPVLMASIYTSYQDLYPA